MIKKLLADIGNVIYKLKELFLEFRNIFFTKIDVAMKIFQYHKHLKVDGKDCENL